VVLRRTTWEYLKSTAEALAAETEALEEELIARKELHRVLGLPRSIRKILARQRGSEDRRQDVRVMRFDFHPTDAGWSVSEVNADVPGGYNEASGWTSIVAEHLGGAGASADPAQLLVEAIASRLPPKATVGMVHATAYSDDRQVMVFLARRLEQRGLRPVLLGPDHIDWPEGRAIVKTSWFTGPIDFVYRFFPAEWLPHLGHQVDWSYYFAGARTPQCNPGTALLTQSKRWPLVWDSLGVGLPVWKKLLPETRHPREVDWKRDPDWIVKPAFGRIGESIGLEGVTSSREWKAIRRAVHWGARYWVAQRRFRPKAILVDGRPWHICFGVYTVNGQAAGIYGRMATQPLINYLARDVAVLIEQPQLPAKVQQRSTFYESVATV
jgi:glutathionylspermidine synthase